MITQIGKQVVVSHHSHVVGAGSANSPLASAWDEGLLGNLTNYGRFVFTFFALGCDRIWDTKMLEYFCLQWSFNCHSISESSDHLVLNNHKVVGSNSSCKMMSVFELLTPTNHQRSLHCLRHSDHFHWFRTLSVSTTKMYIKYGDDSLIWTRLFSPEISRSIYVSV